MKNVPEHPVTKRWKKPFLARQTRGYWQHFLEIFSMMASFTCFLFIVDIFFPWHFIGISDVVGLCISRTVIKMTMTRNRERTTEVFKFLLAFLRAQVTLFGSFFSLFAICFRNNQRLSYSYNINKGNPIHFKTSFR